MKKNIIFTACTLLLSLALSLCAFATKESAPVAKNEKDGITAELYLLPGSGSEVSVSVSVALAENAANISDVSVELTIPDTFLLDSGEPLTKLNVSASGSETVYYKLMSRDAVETVGSTPATEKAEEKGCGAIVSGAALIFALLISAFFVIKNPKRGAAFVFACLMILPLALSANAVTTERKILLEGKFELDGEEHPVTALITYDHSFTEQKTAGTNGMEKFEITYYYGPQGQDLCNEEYIKKIAECGFTSIPVEGYDPVREKTAKRLEILEKVLLTL